MKKIIIGMFSMAALIFSAQAQETRKEKGMKPNHHEREMTAKELNLSAAQQQQLKANKEEAKKQMQELDKQENLTVKDYNARKAAIRKEQKEKMDNILTEEQRKQLASHQPYKKGKHNGMKRTENMEEMKSRLNLSDNQVAQMKTLRENHEVQAKAIRENENLNATDKKEKLAALKAQYKTEHKKILTEEQLQKMKAHKKERKEKKAR